MIGTKYYKDKMSTQEELDAYTKGAEWANANSAFLVDKGDYFEIEDTPLDTFKESMLKQAGATFATKRDAVRYVQLSDGKTYGFDCANEDITNFMAGWKRAELSGSTFYKVYLSPTEKTIVTLTATDFATVSNEVSKSQLLAYSWYGDIKAKILACTTREELESIEIK